MYKAYNLTVEWFLDEEYVEVRVFLGLFLLSLPVQARTIKVKA